MAFEGICTTSQRIPVTFAPRDKDDRPTALKRPCRVTVLSGDGTSLQDPDDTNVIRFVSGSAEGDTAFRIEALDPNDNVTATEDMTLHVQSEAVVSLNPSVGSPEPK